MHHMHYCSSLSPKFHPLRQTAGSIKTLQLPFTQKNGIRNSNQCKKHSIKCSQSSFYSTNKIRNSEDISYKNQKPFHKFSVHAVFQDGYDSKSANDSILTSFSNVLLKSSKALFHLTRPYTWIGTVIAITSVSFLPLQSRRAELTPTFFVGILKVNKPDLPLASGEFSWGTGIATALISSFTSLATGVMSQSPPFLLALTIWFLLGSAYSIRLPYLRWKGHAFLAPMSVMILMGLVYQLAFFVHFQKYVLAKPVVITKPLMFATAIMCIFSFANGLLKDLPDVDGDREFGMQTLCVILGKEMVFWLCVYMMLTAYGAAVLVGASSSFILCKLVTVISHIILASILWVRARTVDLSSNASTLSFYMFLWKLTYVEYLLIHFV